MGSSTWTLISENATMFRYFFPVYCNTINFFCLCIYWIYDCGISSVLKKLRSSSSVRITFSNNQLIFKKHKSSVKVINLRLSVSEVILKFVFLMNIP